MIRSWSGTGFMMKLYLTWSHDNFQPSNWLWDKVHIRNPSMTFPTSHLYLVNRETCIKVICTLDYIIRLDQIASLYCCSKVSPLQVKTPVIKTGFEFDDKKTNKCGSHANDCNPNSIGALSCSQSVIDSYMMRDSTFKCTEITKKSHNYCHFDNFGNDIRVFVECCSTGSRIIFIINFFY